MKYDYDELFEKRSLVGTVIEKEMTNQGITKSGLCKEIGISRPTLDKILNGEVTNKKNFDKHIQKIFQFLNIRPDSLINRNVKIRAVRSHFNISQDHISKMTQIPLKRLEEIEAGAEATLSEYRDIAASLGSGIHSIKNESIFDSNSLGLDSMFLDENSEVSCFWGHIGIVPKGSDEYVWFPISGETRSTIYKQMDQPYLIIPCMNNTVILLNMKNTKKIFLLDEACDQPDNANWDNHVSDGEIPQVVYESLQDYFFGEHDDMSPSFLKLMDGITEQYGWSEDTLDELQMSRIFFSDGTDTEEHIEYGTYENITEFINCILFLEDMIDQLPETLYYSDMEGIESILPMCNVSMITMPMVELEDSLLKVLYDK